MVLRPAATVPPPRSSSVAESSAPGWRPDQPVAPNGSQAQAQECNDEVQSRRKRMKSDRENPIIPQEGFGNVPLPLLKGSNYEAFGSDPGLTRELVNLFFTHRHPQRMIFHKPSFSAALSHNRVPTYLIRAICALAAPLSKQAHFRDANGSSRAAGNPYADEAVALMFNSVVPTANAPELRAPILDLKMACFAHLQALALQVLDELGVHRPDNITTSRTPSTEYIQEHIDRECMRRIFWLIHLLDLISSMFFKVRAAPKGENLRLPVDETSFELGTHASTPAEYLYGPQLRDHRGSELGNVIRVLTIFDKVENMMEGAEGRPLGDGTWIAESERELKNWEDGLPEHLRYSDDTVQIQLSMMETSSNIGAWCFLLMHVIHASCSAALAHARQYDYVGHSSYTLPLWAQMRMELIATSLGSRAKNSMILGCVLWALLKYYKMTEPHVVRWKEEYHKQWGIWVEDTIVMVERRPQPPPAPLRHPLQMPHHHSPYGNDREPGPYSQDHRQSYSRNPMDVSPYVHPRPRDQPSGDASLPSLKSSGLLDSWPPEDTSQHGQAQWSQGRQLPQPPRPQYPISAEAYRGGQSGLPAGMPWLAKESMSRGR
ncbi:hypothetical protein HWV62_17142 [Athelia sp. TMB]|nr:hypothetical protein HWV62_17142 [Athelia sp. TMB]